MPIAELGGSVTHFWTDGRATTLIGLSPKIALRSEFKGIGVAVDGSVALSADHGRVETASLIVPLTVPMGNALRINLDGGWLWIRAGDTHAGFVGAQAELQVQRALTLMAEAFTRTVGKAGGQIGLRWTPHRGAIDIDLIAGRYVDGAERTSGTLGLTVRY
jgi:hypothetical protein